MIGEIALFIAAGFLAQMIDGVLGMGYGVTATSLLLTSGVPPAFASASVHTAEVVATGASGWAHWRAGNVQWSFAKRLIIPGVLGAIAGAYLLSRIPGETMRPWIASYLIVMGVVILWKAFRVPRAHASEPRVGPLALAGGFFDAVGGGGWGPIVVGTLLAHGNPPRTTIGSVNFAEFFVTFAASATLLLTIGAGNWRQIGALALGGVLAAPIAARLTGRVPRKPLMIAVATLVIALSVRTLFF